MCDKYPKAPIFEEIRVNRDKIDYSKSRQPIYYVVWPWRLNL